MGAGDPGVSHSGRSTGQSCRGPPEAAGGFELNFEEPKLELETGRHRSVETGTPAHVCWTSRTGAPP